MTVDAANPGPATGGSIPERQQVLTVHSGSGYLFAEYMVDATARVEQFDYEGKRVREVALPALAGVSGWQQTRRDPALRFGFELCPADPLPVRAKGRGHQPLSRLGGAVQTGGLRLRQRFYQSRTAPGAAHHQLPQGSTSIAATRPSSTAMAAST